MPSRDKDELYDIPPMVPDPDQADSHLSGQRARGREIVHPGFRDPRRDPRRDPQGGRGGGGLIQVVLVLLTLTIGVGGYLGYTLYQQYQDDLRQTRLRLDDIESNAAEAAEMGEESAVNLEVVAEQYDLLWANWRANNQTFDEIRAEIARMDTANTESIEQLTESISAIGQELGMLEELQSSLESVRETADGDAQSLTQRVETLEQAMQAVDVYRLQTNDSLFRLQQHLEELQRTLLAESAAAN